MPPKLLATTLVRYYDRPRVVVDGRELLKCSGSGKLRPATPEEFVRQSLIDCLLLVMPALANQISVERSRCDIQLRYVAGNNGYRPRLPPLLIIETKSRSVWLRDGEAQLKTYLAEQKCCDGILTNLDETRHLDGPTGAWRPIETFDEFCSTVQRATERPACVDAVAFASATYGDLAALMALLKLHPFERFRIETASDETIEAMYLKAEGNLLTFRRIGSTRERGSILLTDFARLRAVW